MSSMEFKIQDITNMHSDSLSPYLEHPLVVQLYGPHLYLSSFGSVNSLPSSFPLVKSAVIRAWGLTFLNYWEPMELSTLLQTHDRFLSYLLYYLTQNSLLTVLNLHLINQYGWILIHSNQTKTWCLHKCPSARGKRTFFFPTN